MRVSTPRSIIFDARCLQDPLYVTRGVGQHCTALLRHRPRAAHLHAVAVTDAGLPPLHPSLAALFDEVVPNAYAALRRPAALFVSLSPMTHSPVTIGRLLTAPEFARAAVIYDFIPWQEPDRYLSRPADRLDYHTCLAWLAAHDHFMPISHSAAEALHALVRVPPARVHVTGAPLNPSFEPLAGAASSPQQPRHLLVIGGGDGRKNVECVVRAHARSAALQSARMPLLILGNYDAAAGAGFAALARSCGGDPRLLRVPGHIPQAALMAGFRDALCLVMPSRAEGFSLPVIEGMAAGVPALVSDIPAHRELVSDPGLRFAPDDDAALTGLLDRCLAEQTFRAGIIRQQAAVWPRFLATEVAARFWEPLRPYWQAPLAAPALHAGAKPRVALLSPMPPDRSGVAAYTADCCAELGRLVDLHVFTPTRDVGQVEGIAAIHPLSALPLLKPDFDRVVNVIGNSHFHREIFEMQLRHGGACIAHDSRMLGFYAILLGFERACAVASRELGRPVAPDEVGGWLANEGTLPALFLGEVAASAAPIIMHTAVTARMVSQRHGSPVKVLPFSTGRGWNPDAAAGRSAARARLGLAEDEIAIVSFGFVHASKAPEECVWALSLLRRWGVKARLHFVGESALGTDATVLDALITRLDLVGQVVLHGQFVSRQTYSDYLLGADLGIQMRTYGLGALSAGLLDCAAAGLPTVANEALAEAVGVPSYIRTIDDHLSPVLLAERLMQLLDEGLIMRRPVAEAAAFCDARGFRAYAAGLCRALDLETLA